MITKGSEILKKQKVHMSMFTFFRNTFKYKGGGEIGDLSSYKPYGGRGSGIRQFHTSPCTSSVSSAPMLCNRLIASLIDSSEGGCRSLPRTSCDAGQMYSNVRDWIRKDVASYCHAREKSKYSESHAKDSYNFAVGCPPPLSHSELLTGLQAQLFPNSPFGEYKKSSLK